MMIDLPNFEMGNRIPKVIHQIFLSNYCDALPIEIQENIRKIKQLNRDWKHFLYYEADVEAIILKHYGLEVFQVYQSINFSYGAARADFFRYLLMYAEGGVYLDIKSSVTRPLDDVIASDDLYILSKWDNQHPDWGVHRELESFGHGEYQQWHIIAVAGHPFLRGVIERVINNIQQYNIFNEGVGRRAVLRITGPVAYTLGIESVKSLHPFREIDIVQDFGFEYNIYEALAQNENHKHLFGKHYSKLRTPIVNKQVVKDYYEMILYNMWEYAKKIVRKLTLFAFD